VTEMLGEDDAKLEAQRPIYIDYLLEHGG
jgi:hypothetical protein